MKNLAFNNRFSLSLASSFFLNFLLISSAGKKLKKTQINQFFSFFLSSSLLLFSFSLLVPFVFYDFYSLVKNVNSNNHFQLYSFLFSFPAFFSVEQKFSNLFSSESQNKNKAKDDFILDANFVLFANAWGSAAHEAIGMTAMSALNSKALIQIRRLMNGKDVVDVSSWGDKVALKYPKAQPIHFQKNAFFQCNEVISNPNTNCKKGRCIVNAIKYFYANLSGRNLKKKDNENDQRDNSEEDAYIDFVYPNNKKLTDSDQVKYLINLIGDLHQPLHLGFNFDDFGKKIIGVFGDNDGNTTLYNLWESDIVNKVLEERQFFWNSGWTHVNSIKAVYEQERKYFAQHKEKMFTKWAEESLKILCDFVYFSSDDQGDFVDRKFLMDMIKEHKSQTLGEKDKEFVISSEEQQKLRFVLTYSLENRLFEKIKQLILIAGARTAIVLNDILENRANASALRIGSAINDVSVDNEIHLTGRNSCIWIKDFLINLSIILILLVLFRYITRFHPFSSVEASTHSNDALNNKKKNEELKTQKPLYPNQTEKEMEEKHS